MRKNVSISTLGLALVGLPMRALAEGPPPFSAPVQLCEAAGRRTGVLTPPEAPTIIVQCFGAQSTTPQRGFQAICERAYGGAFLTIPDGFECILPSPF
jgi:hypothetical protein